MLRLSAVFAILVSLSCAEQVVVREVEASCGNATLEEGEFCDDGNAINGDGCTNSCAFASCGDQVTRSDLMLGDDEFEECDDGNNDDGNIVEPNQGHGQLDPFDIAVKYIQECQGIELPDSCLTMKTIDFFKSWGSSPSMHRSLQRYGSGCALRCVKAGCGLSASSQSC